MIVAVIPTPEDCRRVPRTAVCGYCGEAFPPKGLGPHKVRCPQRPTPPPVPAAAAEEVAVVASPAPIDDPDDERSPPPDVYPCTCGDTFSTPIGLRIHASSCAVRRALHTVVTLEEASCRYCGVPCYGPTFLTRHEAECPQRPEALAAAAAAAAALVPCPHCDKSFRGARGLAVHVGRWHWREQLAEAAARPPQRQPRLPGSAPAPRPAPQCCCLTCRGEFSARVIVQHSQACDIVIEDPTESPYACEFCGQRCRTQRGLSHHERICPQNPDGVRERDWWAAMGLDPNERWEPPPPPAPNVLIAEAVLRPLDRPAEACAHCRRSPCENPAVCGRHLRAAAQWHGVPAVTRP